MGHPKERESGVAGCDGMNCLWAEIKQSWTSNKTGTFQTLVCWGFTYSQHLMSYQDGYRLVTVHTHGCENTDVSLGNWVTSTP